VYLIFDGGNGGVEESKGYGSFKLYDKKGGNIIEQRQEYAFPGTMTSNEAEYQTLILALSMMHLYHTTPTHLTIEGDSELVRSQVLGLFKVKALHLQPLRETVVALLEGIEVTYNHVPRKVVYAVFGH